MAKPIYFSLLLLVLCLTYEAYGNYHHRVRHIKLPSQRSSNNFGPYDSSSSSSTAATEANGAVEDAAITSLSPPSPLRKSFSSNDYLEYDRNRGLGLNSKSLRGIKSASTAAAEANGAVVDTAATSLSPSSPLKKSLSWNNSLGYDKNRGLDDLSNKSRVYYGRQPDYMNSGGLNNDQNIQNSMSSRFLNNKPTNGLYNRNNPMDFTSGNLNIGKRQNSMTSSFQGIPDLTKTKINPLASGIARQNSLYPSSNEDDSQRITVDNDNSSMMNMMNSIKKRLNDGGLNAGNIIFKSFRKYCINNDCRILKDGEECSINDHFISNNKYNDLSDMKSKFKLIGQNSFNSLGGYKNDFQEMGKPTNIRLDSTKFSTIIPSIGSSNNMGSYVNMPQKKKPINYLPSEPIDMNEDEANEIRDQVLQTSNFYREKHNLDPFTLDDQLNNCAQDWANEMARSNIFDHRKDNVYGENLYASSDSNNLGEKAVKSWYNEITQFNIDDDEGGLSGNTPTHHMTQLLWKSSTKLGVGVSRNSNGMYNVVANYDPSGNVVGFFKNNLPEIKQEDIKEAKETQNSQTGSEQETSWSSSSKSPSPSQWDYGSYYNH